MLARGTGAVREAPSRARARDFVLADWEPLCILNEAPPSNPVDVPAMTISTDSLAFFAGALALGLLGSACIITTSEDDGDDVEVTDESGPPPLTTGQPSDSTGPVADETSSGPIDETTGGPVGVCTDNLVLDPGFEAGSPSEVWAEASDVFGSPICDTGCTDEMGAAPYAGDWWAWFGGIEGEPENASVAQTITVDPEMAYLSFWFQIRSGAGMGDDVFTVTLGGDTVFMVTDADMPDYDQYRRIDLDVSQWADGGAYELRFASTHTGDGLTSFFLDEVSLVSCSESAGTSTGPDTDGQDSTGGSTGGSTDGTTGGSTDGTTGGSTGASTGSTGSSG